MKLTARDDSVMFPRLEKSGSVSGRVRVLPGIWTVPEHRKGTGDQESPRAEAPRRRVWTGWWTIGAFVVLLSLFAGIGWRKAQVSNSGETERGYHVIFDYDQHPYLNMGRKMRQSGYSKVAPRHRMPGYSLLVSLLYSEADAYPLDPTGKDPRGVSDGYFVRAKVFNLVISCLCLVVLYFVCRRFLPVLESHVVTWGFGLTVAVAKAPYVQPEVLFYTLFLLGLLGLWTLLKRPSWAIALGTALVLAVAFLLKSTVIPLIALFVGCLLVRLAWQSWEARNPSLGSGREPVSPWRSLGCGLAVVAGFALVLTPYFRHNQEMYGEALWDVHSRHYLWMDTPEEKKYWRKAGISEPGFEAPSDRVLPTAESWMATHSLADGFERIGKGWKNNRKLVRKYYPGAYYLAKNLLLVTVVILALLCWRRSRKFLATRWAEILMVLAFFGGYGLLYCWYQAIDVGPRLIMALFLPGLFFLVLAVHRYSEGIILRVGRREAPLRVVLSVALMLFIAYSTIQSFGGPYWELEGGR